MAKTKDTATKEAEVKEVKKTATKRTAKVKATTKEKPAVKKEVAKKEAVMKEPVKKVTVKKEAVKKEPVKKETVKKVTKTTKEKVIDKETEIKNKMKETIKASRTKTAAKAKTVTKEAAVSKEKVSKKKEPVRDSINTIKGKVTLVRPQAIKMERDENGKAIGLSVSGYQAPDGQYYKVQIPFQSKDGKITGKILSSKDSKRFPGWGVIQINDSAVLTMKSDKGEEATLDPHAFKNFISNKNHKIAEQLAIKQEKAKAKEGRNNAGVADGR